MKQFLIIFLVSFTLNANSQTILKLDVGNKYAIVNKMITDVTTEAMGQTIEIKNEFIFNITTSVIMNSQNRLILNSTVTGVSGTVNGAGQNLSFNSEKGEMKNPVAKIFEPIINKDYPKVFNNLGYFIDSSISKLSDEEIAAFKQVGLTTTDPIIFNKGLINRKIIVGNKWQDTTSSFGKVNNKTTTIYEVEKLTLDTAYIKYSSNETFEGTVEQMGVKMEMNGTKKTIGVYKVQISNSIIMDNNYAAEMESTLQYMGSDIPVKSKINGRVIINSIE